MSTDLRHIRGYFQRLLADRTQEELQRQLAPKFGNPAPSLPRGFRHSPGSIARRWQLLGVRSESREALADPRTLAQAERHNRNIENFIGTVKVPVGLVGPLRVDCAIGAGALRTGPNCRGGTQGALSPPGTAGPAS